MPDMKSVLNVGGGSKSLPIPVRYSGWKHDLLDVDPQSNAEWLMDARDMSRIPSASYDAVFCSHNLEHYFRHDGVKVWQGFTRVLKPDGFVEVVVPNLAEVMRFTVERNLDMDDTLYTLPSGMPIFVRDVFFGLGRQIEQSGQDWFAHKTGFSPNSLARFISTNGLPFIAGMWRPQPFEMMIIAFKNPPKPEQIQALGVPLA
jgi:hypothetical protein